MQKPKHPEDKQKQKKSPGDWDGLGNEPRNENLARIRGPGSFEKKEIKRETVSRMHYIDSTSAGAKVPAGKYGLRP